MKRYLKKLRLEIYGWDVYFFNDRKKAVEQLKWDKAGEDTIETWASPCVNGCVSQWTQQKTLYLGVFSGRVGTLAHECVHAAMHILEAADIPAAWGNHEALTYLVGYLANAFVDAEQKSRRRKK